MKRPETKRTANSPGEHWYHQPVAWLGAGLLLASIAGCISMVVLAARYPDEPLPVTSEHLLRMPASHQNRDP